MKKPPGRAAAQRTSRGDVRYEMMMMLANNLAVTRVIVPGNSVTSTTAPAIAHVAIAGCRPRQ